MAEKTWTPISNDPYLVRHGAVDTVHSLTLELALYHVQRWLTTEPVKVIFEYITDRRVLRKVKRFCEANNPSIVPPVICYKLILQYPTSDVKSIAQFCTSTSPLRSVEAWEIVLKHQLKQLAATATHCLGEKQAPTVVTLASYVVGTGSEILQFVKKDTDPVPILQWTQRDSIMVNSVITTA